MTKTITKSEYLQLIGLLKVAEGYNAMLRSVAEAVRLITGEEDDLGHSSDAVYSDSSADELLKKLGITVEETRNDTVSD